MTQDAVRELWNRLDTAALKLFLVAATLSAALLATATLCLN